MKLEGKAAIVTGSGTGVGRETALALAQGGCHVLVNYSRSRDEAEQTCAEVRALGVKSIAVQADIAQDAACRGMVAAAVEAFGRLDVLVNNAGTTTFISHGDLEAVQDEDWQRIMGVNLVGPFQCARAARVGARGERRRLHRERLERRGHPRNRQLVALLRVEGRAQQPHHRARARARAQDPSQRRRARVHHRTLAAAGPRRARTSRPRSSRRAARRFSACATRRTSPTRSCRSSPAPISSPAKSSPSKAGC